MTEQLSKDLLSQKIKEGLFNANELRYIRDSLFTHNKKDVVVNGVNAVSVLLEILAIEEDKEEVAYYARISDPLAISRMFPFGTSANANTFRDRYKKLQNWFYEYPEVKPAIKALYEAKTSTSNNDTQSQQLKAKPTKEQLEEERATTNALREKIKELEWQISDCSNGNDIRLGALAYLVAKIGGNRYRHDDGAPNVHQIVTAVRDELVDARSLEGARGLGKSQFNKVLSDSVRLFSKHVKRQHVAKPESKPESEPESD